MQAVSTIAWPKGLSLKNESMVAQAFWVSTFSILTALGAQVQIPHNPVPFTLQTFFVLLSGAMLGKRNGCLSMALYLLFGAVGLPVFSGAGFGLARIIGPTGGYLLAFPVAAFFVGYFVPLRQEFLWVIGTMLFGLLIIFSLGTIQLNEVLIHNWRVSLQSGFLIFSWWDVVKLGAASSIFQYYRSRVKK